MSSVNITILRNESSPDFEIVINWLESAGLTLLNPRTLEVSHWTASGERTVVDKNKVLDCLRQRVPFNVQTWIESDIDVFVSWTDLEATLFLDGLTVPQRIGIASAILRGFLGDSRCEYWTIKIGKQ